MNKASVSFEVDGEIFYFEIMHNCPARWGLNLECAVESWLFRTQHYTAESLCAYIKSKGFRAEPYKQSEPEEYNPSYDAGKDDEADRLWAEQPTPYDP